MTVTVREARLADYAGFARVAYEVHEHHVEAVPEVFRSVSVIVSEAQFKGLVDGNDSDVYVAVRDDVVVGYALLSHRRTTRDLHVPRAYSFIDNFGVLKADRNLGVGRMLFNACVSKARERGSGNLELDCWEANDSALRFYESMGMHPMRRWLSMDL